MHRHPILTLRKADNLERSRAEAFNPDIVNEYFEMLDTVLTSNNLKKSPRRIYNCDETFLQDYTREKVITMKGSKMCITNLWVPQITLACYVVYQLLDSHYHL